MKNQIKVICLLITAAVVPSAAFAFCSGEYQCREEAASNAMIERMHQNEQAMYDREHAEMAAAMGATFVPLTGNGAPGEYHVNGTDVVCGYSDWGGGIGCIDSAGRPAPQYAPSRAAIRAAFARADGHPLPADPSYRHRRHRR